MTNSKLNRAGALALLLAGALALSACGIRGDLERPAPIWGEDMRTDEERAHETEDEG
ncbi:MAG: lipoprotein [Pseudomonadota bacterium]